MAVGVEAIGVVMRRCRLRWHGHVERKDDADYAKECRPTRLVVEGTAPVVSWRKQNTLIVDTRLLKVEPWDIQNRMTRRP